MGTGISTTTLTPTEEQFIYNIEVLGLTQQRAAQLSGVASPQHVLKRPDVMVAREALRNEVRRRVELSKEDVIDGIKRAIEQADLLADPMAQIAGWREIAKMLGYDAPREVKVTISMDANTRRRQIAQLTDEDLVELLGADNVIDADFREMDGNQDP